MTTGGPRPLLVRYVQNCGIHQSGITVLCFRNDGSESSGILTVTKRLGKDGSEYDDGEYIVYVNAEVDDGSRIAKLMKYFKTADPNDNSEGDLSKRVHFLKCEEGGMDIMCEVAERMEKRGSEKKAKTTAQNLYQMGMAPEKIAQAVGEDVSMVRQWLTEIKQ